MISTSLQAYSRIEIKDESRHSEKRGNLWFPSPEVSLLQFISMFSL
jgi:hypothetical protein